MDSWRWTLGGANMTNIISIYGSHNSTIVLSIDEKIQSIIEVERFTNCKNAAIAQYKVVNNPHVVMQSIMSWIKKEFGITKVDVCLHQNTEVIYDEITYVMKSYIDADKYISVNHHQSHAAGTFYQSPYQDALIFSFDGGGNDGMFNIYLANRTNGVTLIDRLINPIHNNPHICYDLGFPYMIFGHYLNDIRLEVLGDGNLVYPGKLMGLASYGNINQNWLGHFIDFYKQGADGNNYGKFITELGKKIDVVFDTNARLSGQLAYDIAATSQRAFEECFLEVAIPYMQQYPELPVCITGGCGLNIILNTRLVNEFNKQVFVGPNPNDCGIAVGALLDYLKPQHQVDVTYAGIPLLDLDLLSDYAQSVPTRELTRNQHFNKHFHVSHDIVLNDLVNGKIVGVARGNSEHGPRALGNRSILCNPSVANMKDVLNAKVKNREWYRPFAPVVRLEDVNKYFEWDRDARWMSFCPIVRPDWREQLAAITHVDNTARVQTVTREENEWLYDLLTEFEKHTGVGVLLNTSFNVNGKPILSTIKDAFQIYNQTQMDCLLIEDTYFRKEGFFS